MDGTILGQGRFVAPATIGNQIIHVPSGVDWIKVRNYTQAGTAGVAAPGSLGFEFFWQRGMPAGTALVKYKQAPGNATAEDLILTGGFTLYDPSGQTLGAQPLLGSAVIITGGVSAAAQPVVTTANTAGVAVGTVVRVFSPGQGNTAGVDFVVGAVTPGVSFTLLTATNALNPAPAVAGVGGFYRIVNTEPLFYPRRRTITNITQALNGQVSTAQEHSLTVGQEIRFNIPAVSGMIQLNPDPLNNYFPRGSSVAAIVVSIVDPYNFTINIDTLTYTAFTYPTILQQPSSFPLVMPFGEDTATSLASNTAQVPQFQGQNVFNANSGILADSTVNTGFLGMILGTGGVGVQLGGANLITGPAGSVAGDEMYWLAGKSTYGGL